MVDLYDLIDEYITIEYSPNQQALYYRISKISDKKIYVDITRIFEKSGLVSNDIVLCKVYKESIEYHFKAKILNIESEADGLKLVITPVSPIEEYYDFRKDRRINFKLMAFINNILASVVNLSRSGVLLLTKSDFAIGDGVKVKLLLSYPNITSNFMGVIVREKTIDSSKEYGIKIIKFHSQEDENRYNEFLNEIETRFKR